MRDVGELIERLRTIKRGESYADAIYEAYGPRPVGQLFDDFEEAADALQALQGEVGRLREALVFACRVIVDAANDLHQRRVGDWYPEGAHNAAEAMDHDMRLIGNWLIDQHAIAIAPALAPIEEGLSASGVESAATRDHSLAAPNPEFSAGWRAAIAAAVNVCREHATEFLSPSYATNQPMSSIGERFACAEIAGVIQKLDPQQPQHDPLRSDGGA